MERADQRKSNADVEQLKAEISETQGELQQTVIEIQERLSPTHLKHRAADSVRGAASNVRDATIERVQHMTRGQNAIPYALIGIGAAWLLAGHRSSRRWDGRDDGEYDSSWDTSTSYLSSDVEFSSPYSGTLDDEMRGRRGVGELGSEARDRASQMSRHARDRARRMAGRTRSRWDSMLNENPIALGIAALAAGAVVGAALPRTETEDDYLGETRDQLVDSAKSMAQEKMDSAKTAAKDAAKGAVQQVTGREETRR